VSNNAGIVDSGVARCDGFTRSTGLSDESSFAMIFTFQIDHDYCAIRKIVEIEAEA
jgi:hypothetical protein